MVQAAAITALLTAGLTLSHACIGASLCLTAMRAGAEARYTFKSKRNFSFLGAALWPPLSAAYSLCCRHADRACQHKQSPGSVFASTAS